MLASRRERRRRVKPGIVIMSEIRGELADLLGEIHAAFDPRMARELPPHITITGSSGMGPIAPSTSDDALSAALAPVASATTPFTVHLQPPMRFMQSTVVVMTIDPNGPIRALHEAIKSSGLSYEPARFTFTPHVTLSFYPELDRVRLRELLRVRWDRPVVVDALQAYRAVDLTRTRKVLDLPLSGLPPAAP